MRQTERPAGWATGGLGSCLPKWWQDTSEHSPNRLALQVSAHPAARRRDPRFEHHIRRCHALGPRPLAELLGEIADATGCPEIIAQRLAAYARLEPETLRALGADRFPPLPFEVAP